MICRQESRGRPAAHDEGFTLAEALVGLVIFGITIAAAMPAVLGGLVTQQTLQSRQNAVAIAGAALEQLQALSAQDQVGDCPPLLAGRVLSGAPFVLGGQNVTNQFTDAPAEVGAATMAPVGNPRNCTYPAAGEEGDPVTNVDSSIIEEFARAMDYTETVDDVVYRVRTYVGECALLPASGTTPAECVHPSAVPAHLDGTMMYRLVAHAQWSDDECTGGVCAQVVSSLSNRGGDPLFKDFSDSAPGAPVDATNVVGPVNDSFTANKWSDTFLDILANDVNAHRIREVQIMSHPEKGELAGNAMLGTLTYYHDEYVASIESKNRDSFTYRTIDLDGRVSAIVTVAITRVWDPAG